MAAVLAYYITRACTCHKNLTPIYYLLVTTFKSGTEAAAKPMALPSSWDITPYINAFEKMQYPRAFGNTLIITVCAVFGIVMSSTMCGYVLNRKEKSKITKIIFLVILSGMLVCYIFMQKYIISGVMAGSVKG